MWDESVYCEGIVKKWSAAPYKGPSVPPSRLAVVDLRDRSAIADLQTYKIRQFFNTVLAPDGSSLAAVDWSSSATKFAHVWDLSMLAPGDGNRSKIDLRKLHELNAGGRSVGGTWETLDGDAWLLQWQEFRKRHPDLHPLPK